MNILTNSSFVYFTLLLLLLPSISHAQNEPPWVSTLSIDRNILLPTDPTTFYGLGYLGRKKHYTYDRRADSWGVIYAYIFDMKFSDGTQTQAFVSPEFGNIVAARAQAQKYAFYLGQLPRAIRDGLLRITIFDGDAKWGGLKGEILVHTDHGAKLERTGMFEETLFHEAIHSAVELNHKNNPVWHAAQKADGISISKYGNDYPIREDFAETFLMYFLSRYVPDRVPPSILEKVNNLIPNRLKYLDNQNLNLSPYMPNTRSRAATIVSHTPEADIEGKSVTFSWNQPHGVYAYQLNVGTDEIGSNTILSSEVLDVNQLFVEGLPDDHKTLYVRLWSASIADGWVYRDYRFTSPTLDSNRTTASIIYPKKNGAVFNGVREAFYWDNPKDATHYDLLLGSYPGGNDILSSDVQEKSIYTFQHKATEGLPSDGRNVYARLWTHTDSWNYKDFVYKALNDPDAVSMLSPLDGTQLDSSSVVFDFVKPHVDKDYFYDLIVGTNGVHSNNIRASSITQDESLLIEGLPIDGRTVYATLWTKKGNNPWMHKLYTYKAANGITTRVAINSDSSGSQSQLESSNVLFEWDKPDEKQENDLYLYDLIVGTEGKFSSNIRSSSTTTNQLALVKSLPTNGSTIYVTLWTKIGDNPWRSKQYTYQTTESVSATK
ncbi:hypothetical protein [Shewanella nanhaiensis]|uniref:Fibronectin type-III domain-containing protein n=1 Tax=Shewanella nanhaiensis TaxID=2864872 RepID=A0ABS7E203_9GAMM|nr:hypothetical protein [Shewanella nanhaiensis]MBW8183042.1 hypothetical protein [Shewanella nanhaiensis]